jgi:hypothetical protein
MLVTCTVEGMVDMQHLMRATACNFFLRHDVVRQGEQESPLMQEKKQSSGSPILVGHIENIVKKVSPPFLKGVSDKISIRTVSKSLSIWTQKIDTQVLHNDFQRLAIDSVDTVLQTNAHSKTSKSKTELSDVTVESQDIHTVKWIGHIEKKLEIIEEVDDSIAGFQLLEQIALGTEIVLEGLYLSCESIIKTEELFSMIHRRIVSSMQSNDCKDVAVFMDFCSFWASKNRGTSYLLKALPMLTEILTEVMSWTNKKANNLKIFAERLFTKLLMQTSATLKDMNVSPIITVADSATMGSFEKSLMLVASGRVRQYKTLCQSVAYDFALFQRNLFIKLKPEHFINKWNGHSSVIKEYTNNFNQLATYLRDQILLTKGTKERARMICFFLDIADASLKGHNDFTTSLAIYAALNVSYISRLKDAWAIVHRTKQMKVLTDLSEQFSTKGNFKNQRIRYEQLSKAELTYIPYLGLILQDITFIEDGNPGKCSTALGKTYNIEKLKMLLHAIQNILVSQPRLLLLYKDDYKTGLIEKYVTYKELSKEELVRLSNM